VLPSTNNFLGKRSRGRIHSSRGTYYQDPNVEANALDPDAYLSDSDSEIFDINVAELIAGKPYTCKALAKTDSKSSDRSQNSQSATKAPQNENKYSFDITKADSIFDQLYQDKQLKLSQGHTIPSKEEIKDKKYFKWHNTRRHNTNNCVVFRNVIQDAIEKGEAILPSPIMWGMSRPKYRPKRGMDIHRGS
jgi:hypothetical protein